MPYRGPSTPTLVSRVWQLAADLLGEGLAELETPLAHNLMAHLDAAGRQHLFHHAQAQRKAEVEPHGVADDLCGKAVAGGVGLGAGCHAGPLPVPACPAKPRPKLTVPSSLCRSVWRDCIQLHGIGTGLRWGTRPGSDPRRCDRVVVVTGIHGYLLITFRLRASVGSELEHQGRGDSGGFAPEPSSTKDGAA